MAGGDPPPPPAAPAHSPSSSSSSLSAASAAAADAATPRTVTRRLSALDAPGAADAAPAAGLLALAPSAAAADRRRRRRRPRSRSRSRASGHDPPSAPPRAAAAGGGITVLAPAGGAASIAAVLRPSAAYEGGPRAGAGGSTAVLLARVFGFPVDSNLNAFLHVNPVAAAVVDALCLGFFNFPRGDLRGGGIDPKLRALVVFAASSAAQSAFWMSAAPLMPASLRGSPAVAPKTFGRLPALSAADLALTSRSLGAAPPRLPPHGGLSPATLAAIRLAAAMANVPHTCSQRLVDGARAALGERRTEQVILAVTATGFLHKWVELVDVSVDWRSFKYLDAHAGDMGGVALGRHFSSESLERDMLRERQGDAGAGGARLPHILRSVGAVIGAPLRVLRVLRPAREHRVLRGIPTSAMGQREQLQDELGFYPYWLDGVKDRRALRAFLGIIDSVLLSEREGLSRAVRALMCLVLARGHENGGLTSQFGYLAFRFGATDAQLAQAEARGELEAACRGGEAGAGRDGARRRAVGGALPFQPLEASALLLAHCSAGGASFHIKEREVALVKRSMTHAGIAEAVTVISTFSMAHRFTAASPSSRLEPVVLEFCESEAGARLRMPVP